MQRYPAAHSFPRGVCFFILNIHISLLTNIRFGVRGPYFRSSVYEVSAVHRAVFRSDQGSVCRQKNSHSASSRRIGETSISSMSFPHSCSCRSSGSDSSVFPAAAFSSAAGPFSGRIAAERAPLSSILPDRPGAAITVSSGRDPEEITGSGLMAGAAVSAPAGGSAAAEMELLSDKAADRFTAGFAAGAECSRRAYVRYRRKIRFCQRS